jgi:hypothetical protein
MLSPEVLEKKPFLASSSFWWLCIPWLVATSLHLSDQHLQISPQSSLVLPSLCFRAPLPPFWWYLGLSWIIQLIPDLKIFNLVKRRSLYHIKQRLLFQIWYLLWPLFCLLQPQLYVSMLSTKNLKKNL